MSVQTQIAHRYAKAFFEAVSDSGTKKAQQDAEKEIIALRDSLDKNENLRDFLADPSITQAEQMAVVTDIANKMKLSDLVSNLLKLLVRNRRLEMMGAVLNAVLDLYAQSRDKMVAHVTSAKKVSAAQTKEIVSILESKTGKKISLETRIDETLIGGVVIQYGSTLIDNSVKTKLDKMKRQLKGAA